MATTTNKKLNKIPQREDINDKHKWNLIDVYDSIDSWEMDFEKVKGLIEKAKDFIGKLSKASVLFECLETRTELSKLTSRLYLYAHLSKDLDSRLSKYQALTDRAATLSAYAGAAFSFIEPELLKLTDQELMKLSNQFITADLYDFFIKELIRSREHIRSEEVEELLSLSAVVAKGPETIFSLLDDADLKYPVVQDENGDDIQLTKQRFARLLDSSIPKVRRNASNAFHSVYKDHINTLNATLSTEINKNIFYTKARRYKSCLHYSLDGDNIPETVYHSLIKTTEANLNGLNKWVSLRKKILKLDEIMPYDMYCPLFPEKDYEVPYEQAVNNVLEAAQPLGEKYHIMLKTAFDSQWVDVYETEGKTGGAYSWGQYGIHPFILMNYNDTVDNMFTLAHEMGHAIHSHLSNSTQPFPKAQYSTFVAEVASTLNEGLLMQYLLNITTDKEEKLYLLNRHIDNTMGTFFHQVMYAHFEWDMHKHVEKGQALSPDFLNELWIELSKKYYGPSLTLDEFSHLKWSRIPHFYSAFYVYQYATSYAASQA
ncbi:MAG: oligoendopeptidase F, partial [Candidatus Zixiibacteriota bacterium]